MARRGTRPARGEIDEAALELLARHGAQILATARRHAVTPEDAEDAYQRGIEILLTKAPSTREDELIPWLKTVVKHEALRSAASASATRRSPTTASCATAPAPTAVTHEQAERLERLRLGAEALGHLKPHEVRALRAEGGGLLLPRDLRDDGLVVHEGQPAADRGPPRLPAAGVRIERGAECARYEPLLSALADGEASAEQLAVLRPHMRTCLSCRARAARVQGDARARGGAGAAGGAGGGGRRRAAAEPVEVAAGAALGERLHAAAELATGQKVAAVAASAAALAGGGTAIDEFANHQGPPLPEPVQQVEAQPVKEEAPVEPAPPAAESPPADAARRRLRHPHPRSPHQRPRRPTRRPSSHRRPAPSPCHLLLPRRRPSPPAERPSRELAAAVAASSPRSGGRDWRKTDAQAAASPPGPRGTDGRACAHGSHRCSARTRTRTIHAGASRALAGGRAGRRLRIRRASRPRKRSGLLRLPEPELRWTPQRPALRGRTGRR